MAVEARPREAAAPDAASAGPSLYEQIVENALAAVGAQFVNLSLLDRSDMTLHGTAWAAGPRALYDTVLAAVRLLVPGFEPHDVTFSVHVNPNVEAVHLEGRQLLKRFDEFAAGAVDARIIRLSMLVVGLRYTFSVPVHVGGEVAGSLAFHFGGLPDERQRRVASAFAHQAELTLDNARLSTNLAEHLREIEDSRQRLVSAEDRARREIAELLHGRVQARLLVATQRLVEIRERLGRGEDGADMLLAAAIREFDRIREEDVRHASHMLHPSFISVGLVPALRMLAERYEPALRVDLDVSREAAELDDPLVGAIPEPLRLAAYRVAEEGLTNVARHAGVRWARLRVELEAGDVRRLAVTVSDDGRGLDPTRGNELGLGLRTVRDRVELFDGTWRIESAPGRGTALRAALPL